MDEKSAFLQLKEDEREIRKAIIIKATFKLFKKKVFHKIGMRDIAREAGVSAASIYRYFPSRDDLFVESLIQEIKKIKAKLKKTLTANNTLDDLALQNTEPCSKKASRSFANFKISSINFLYLSFKI